MAEDICFLALEEYEKELIRQAGSKVHYNKGQIVFAAGDVANRVYLIEDGWVKIYRLTKEGRQVTVGSIRHPGELMGLAEALCDGGDRTCYSGAITNITLTVVRQEAFNDLLTRHPMLAIKVARLLAARMREAESAIQEMVCWQVPGRLAQTLLKIGQRCGEETDDGIKLKMRLTHEELAAMIGASRQTVTSLMNTLKQEQSITLDGREIKIKDPKKLGKWMV